MKSLFKKLFSAVYILSPIVILFFVSALALTGNDNVNSFHEKEFDKENTKQAATEESKDQKMHKLVFIVAAL